ncbi:MAG: hypothetical protein J7J73_01835 [Deltaproteobacteria bacterium]|nr:hypothetical protein [Deltaproteobacteria bacterium]
MKILWVKVKLINGEEYIGSINIPDEEDELLTILEEKTYWGLKLDDTHLFKGKEIIPLNSDKTYTSEMLIMSDHILTIKFLHPQSKLYKELDTKKKKTPKKKLKKNNLIKWNILKNE